MSVHSWRQFAALMVCLAALAACGNGDFVYDLYRPDIA